MAIDPSFFANLAGVVCMGGYERRLRFLRREVDELNLTADPAAAATVLHAPCPVALMTAQLCLQARFALRHLPALVLLPGWLAGAVLEWFTAFSYYVGSRGFFLWDTVPVLYYLHPERFVSRRVRVCVGPVDTTTGRLCFSRSTGPPQSSGVVDVPVRILRGRRVVWEALVAWRRATRRRVRTW